MTRHTRVTPSPAPQCLLCPFSLRMNRLPQQLDPLKHDGQQGEASPGDTGLLTPIGPSGHPGAAVHGIHFLETHPFPMTKERRPDSQLRKTFPAAVSPLLFLAHDYCVSKYKIWKV